MVPTVLASGAESGGNAYGVTLAGIDVDDITIENSPTGIRVKAGGIDQAHLSFTPAMKNHKHKDSFTGSGWKVSEDGIIHSAGWDTRISPDGMLALGHEPDIIKLSSTNPTYRLWVGDNTPSTAPFRLKADGSIVATKGEIATWNITTGKIYADSERANLVAGAYPWIGLGTMTEFGEAGTNGIWMGRDTDETYKLYVGNPAGDHMYWDGDELFITGTFVGSADISETMADTFTINADLDNVTAKLVFGRTTGGNAELGWTGTEITSNKPLSITGKITLTDDLTVDTDTLLADASEDMVYINAGALPTYRGALTVRPAVAANRGFVLQGVSSQSGDLMTVYDSSNTILWRSLASGDIQSGNYASGTTGWNISSGGDAEFNSITARGEMRASVFTYGDIHATAGTMGIFKSASKLYADYTSPASSGSNTVDIDDDANDNRLIATGDFIRIKTLTATGVADVWLEVTGYTNHTGYTTYNVTHKSGSTSTTFRAGTAVADYGQYGDGLITLSADGTVGSSPNINLAISTAIPWTTLTSTVRLGNLNGVLGLSADEHGLAFGKDLSNSTLPYGIFSDQRSLLQGITQHWLNSEGDVIAKVNPDAEGSQNLFWVGTEETNESLGFRADGIMRVTGSVIFGSGFGVLVNNSILCLPFDGETPVATNYDVGTQDTVSLKIPTTTAGFLMGVRGKYGKALATGRASTNYINNPSFESTNITDGWTLGGTGGAATKGTGAAYMGSYGLKLTAGSVAGVYMQSNATSVPSGSTVVIQVVAHGVGNDYKIAIRDTSSSIDRADTGTVTSSAWTHHTLSWTNTTGGARNVAIRIYNMESDSSSYIYADCAQQEIYASTSEFYPTVFFCGDFPGCAWSGTAHLSSSTRTASNLHYTLTMPAQWTMSFWLKPSMLPSEIGSTARVILWQNSGTNYYDVRYNPTTDMLALAWVGNSVATTSNITTLTRNDWHHIEIRFDGTYLSAFVNGVFSTMTTAVTAMTATPSNLYIGCDSGASAHFNGTIDDLVISSVAVETSDTFLVEQIYNSTKPVEPVGTAATISFVQSDYGRLVISQKGIWANAGDNSGIFGLSTDQSAPTWGGVSMGEGDIVIGHNQAGSAAMHWDRDTGRLKFLGDGNPVAAAYIDNEGVKAAGGEIVLNSSGITFNTAAAEGTEANALKWKLSGTLLAYLENYNDGSDTYLKMRAAAVGLYNSTIDIMSWAPSTKTGTLNLMALSGSGTPRGLVVQADDDSVTYPYRSYFNTDLYVYDNGLFVGQQASTQNPGSGVIIAETDMYSVAWTNYSSTSTVTGWSSTTTKSIYYKQLGKMVYVIFNISGTSNTTSASLTLPVACNASTGAWVIIPMRNNGVYGFGSAKLSSSSNTLNFYSGAGTEAWVGSGTKQVFGEIFYHTA